MSDNGGTLRFEMLGPLRVWRDNEQLTPGWPRQQAVLAALLFRAGHAVTLDELIDAVWGAQPPKAATNIIHTYMSRLRKVLLPQPTARNEAQSLISSRAGYSLMLPADRIDSVLFEKHLSQARIARSDGDLRTQTGALEAALRLWHGRPLAGIPGQAAEAHRIRLEELRLTAIEDHAQAMLAQENAYLSIAELSALVREHPLRERLRAYLMMALYRGGRQVEALAEYRDIRRLLVDEMGVEPSLDLQRTNYAILNNDATGPMTWREPVAVRRPPHNSVIPRQVPPPVRHFIGRAIELRILNSLLKESADGTVVVINGTAGTGKTALATYWAHMVEEQFPDGQLHIDLRGFDPDRPPITVSEAVRGLLEAFAVPSERIPTSLDAQIGLYRSALANRRVLLILDNARECEQVRALLPGSPRCLALVTSRRRLIGLIAAQNAQPLTLDLLTPAESHSLLASRLGRERISAEPDAVEDLVASCNGLPSALSIVAARAASNPTLPLRKLVKEMHSGRHLEIFATDSNDQVRVECSIFCECPMTDGGLVGSIGDNW